MPDIAYVNGQFCDAADAVVSIDDRGFQFADSVYEVVVAFGGVPFRLPEHLARLRRSLSLVEMSFDESRIDLAGLLREGIRRCEYDECMAYLQITRGVQPRAHLFRDDLTPTVIATFRPKRTIDASLRESGISIVTVPDTRRTMCEVKATGLLPNILALHSARRQGFHDAVFVDASGCVREATSANIFAIENGELITPITSESILHGITRAFVIECAEKSGIRCREMSLDVARLERADEAFVCSTTIDVLSVTRVNKHVIGDGSPGPITSRLYRTFLAEMQRPLNG
jgi:D-alanine transaminase